MDPKLCEAAMNGDFQGIIGSQEPLDLLSQLTPKSNHTILHIAVEFNQTAFVENITQHCPSLLWLPNSVGDTAIHVAARSEAHQKILKILINVATSQTHDIETTQSGRGIEVLRMVNSENDTALHCAARLGNARCVELLVKADPELCSFVNKANESPLYLAAASGNSSPLKFILDVALPSTPYKGPTGLTALHAAQLVFKYGCEENKLLVNWRKEMISETDDSGSTPLHYAAIYGRTQAVKLFLKYDSPAIYVSNTAHDSALHVAAFFGHVDTLKELINHCPDSCYLINNKGRTVLHTAVLGNRGHVVKFILKTRRLAMMLNKPDDDGNTPLHLAALSKLYDMIEILIKCPSVNLRIQNKKYVTAPQIYDKPEEEKDTSKIILSPLEKLLFPTKSKGDEIFRHFSDVQERLKKMEEKANKPEDVEPNWENRRSLADANMIIGTLVATVSFAAGFTMPGGYMSEGADKGLATFTDKPAFQAFIVSNFMAFCSSLCGVLFNYRASIADLRNEARFSAIATGCIGCSLYAMSVAFFSGNYVVLTQSKPLSIAPMVIFGFIITTCVYTFMEDNIRFVKLFITRRSDRKRINKIPLSKKTR